MDNIWLVLIWVLLFTLTIVQLFPDKKLSGKNSIEVLQILAKIAVDAAEQVGNYKNLNEEEKYEWAANMFEVFCEKLKLYTTKDETKGYIEAAVYKLNSEG